jgi:hypothetical protein
MIWIIRRHIRNRDVRSFTYQRLFLVNNNRPLAINLSAVVQIGLNGFRYLSFPLLTDFKYHAWINETHASQ